MNVITAKTENSVKNTPANFEHTLQKAIVIEISMDNKTNIK